MRAMVFKSDPPGGLRENCVVFPETGIESRPEATAALTDDNCAAGDHVAVVGLDAQPLRI